jgi:hypothetical protein
MLDARADILDLVPPRTGPGACKRVASGLSADGSAGRVQAKVVVPWRVLTERIG